MADPDADAEDKKHDPGERQWRDAAEHGRLARSADVGAAAVLAVGAALLLGVPGPMVGGIRRMLTLALDRPHAGLATVQDGGALLQDHALGMIGVLVIPLGGICLAAIAAGLVQTRGELATRALEWDGSRLDPVQNFRNAWFGATPWIELARALAKVAIAAGAAYLAIGDRFGALPRLAAAPPSEQVRAILELATRTTLWVVPAVVVLAVLDYAWSYRRVLQQLMRTDEELRRDHRESDGDPRFKAHRRARARQLLLRGGGLRAVAEADVIVTNPTHYAVALRYRRGRDKAPVVVAKGADHLAAKIREEARKHGIPRVEDRPLARALFARAPVGDPIPEDLFGPVARVLAIVMRRRARRALRPSPQPV